ncbi:hypothetical protein [Akkermansia sp.]|uniref:hypothetical protein n=1 Tax=Akkermansia sp. TaxID=1872421 RepID=UPI0025BC8C61|nr:hypothetical protein [Akkermansia sp.]MCD8065041.1 hypothetical protein [Akkermansia sp.]
MIQGDEAAPVRFVGVGSLFQIEFDMLRIATARTIRLTLSAGRSSASRSVCAFSRA